MIYTSTTDQVGMSASLRAALDKRSTTADVRSAARDSAGFDRGLWKLVGADMGLAAMLVPVQYDGLGLGMVDTVVVQRELGASLACLPFLSSAVLATQVVIELAGPSEQAEILPTLASATSTATLALCDGKRADYSLDGIEMVAEQVSDTTVLTGTKVFVPDGTSADVLLVVARDDTGLGVYRVNASAAGVDRQPMDTVDETRPLARVSFDRVEAMRIGTGDAHDALSRALARSSVALAAEQVGAARECVRMSVDYAKMRVQFGRPIGAFQAIKHMLADGLSAVEAADAATSYAAHAVDSVADDSEVAAAVAQAASSDAYLRVSADCVQVHGAMGFTEECDAQLFLKRARSTAQLLGSASHHRATAARLLGL